MLQWQDVIFPKKKNKKGIETLKNGLDKSHSNSNILFMLASTNYSLGNYVEAKKYYLELAKKIKTDKVCNRIGLTFEALFDFKNSQLYYEEGLLINPNNTDILCNLGSLFRSLGDFEKGLELYKKAKHINQFLPEVHRYISVITKYKSKEDSHLQEMLNLISSDEVKKNQVKYHQIYFALSKAYEDLKDFKKSVSFLNIGNKLRKQTINKKYTLENVKIHFSILKEIFDYFRDQNIILSGSNSIKPIFILGMPRSGTTLVEQIISSHQKVDSGGELDYIGNIIYDYFPDTDIKTFALKNKLDLPNKIQEMASIYLDKLSIISSNFFVTDKLPHNFVFIGFIKSMFPNCKIIHCIRDARSTCLSIYKNYFPDDSLWFAYDENDLTSYYKLYEDLMSYWNTYYEKSIYKINYEQLVSNQEEETKKILKFLELDWDKNCLEFNKNKAKVATLSTSQVRQPIYKSSIEQWKLYENLIPNLFKKLI